MTPQLPVQPNSHLNNKVIQQIEMPILPSYCISFVECNDVHMKSGIIINSRDPPIIIEETPKIFENLPKK